MIKPHGSDTLNPLFIMDADERTALIKEADGILIHMLSGKLKEGDIPADVRDAAIRKMVEQYFPPDTVLITGYGFDMLYAGPREAALHAVFRQNSGCTHLIVGRDHAGSVHIMVDSMRKKYFMKKFPKAL